MSQSSLEHEILYDRDYQADHQAADASCKTIESSIDTWTELIVHAEIKLFELREELVGARKKVAEIYAARRSVGVVSVVSVAERMQSKINEAFTTIDDMLKRKIVLPDAIAMRLESLMLLPDHAPSEIAASAYQELTHHVKGNKLDTRQFALLDRQMMDVVCLACCRFIDPCDKGETRKLALQESFTVAFGGRLRPELHSRLGNSHFQLFMRDFNTHPVKEPGSKHPEESERAPRIRRRVHRTKRTTSEPVSESRAMTGSFVQLQHS